MMNIINTIKQHIMNVFDFGAVKVGIAMIAGYFVSIFDIPTREAMLALIILSVLDFLGKLYVIAVTDDIYKSEKIATKAYKLMGHLILVWIGALINHSVQVPTTYGIDDLLIAWFGLAEGVSILEKAKRLGFNIPNFIFKKIQDKREELESNVTNIINNEK